MFIRSIVVFSGMFETIAAMQDIAQLKEHLDSSPILEHL